ncbi:uncharacterized protein [Spinacia oleracea]|uniref:Uncharacterized protein isoform X3 n=1 Tax=Spinacia oleracea TaxID=3562 RepID=A0ABM3RCC2_SPIOL|nr:uncharacterized protein LOC110794067 isoform X3 [Spinacia oleracea]
MGSLTTTKYAISRRYGLDGVGDRQHQIAVCVFSRRSSGFSHMENSLPALNLVLMAVKSGQVRSPFLLDLLSMEVQVSYCASAARIHATLVQKKSMFIPTLISLYSPPSISLSLFFRFFNILGTTLCEIYFSISVNLLLKEYG